VSSASFSGRPVREKSTLLNIIGGIDSADSGYISIHGDKLQEMSEKKIDAVPQKASGLCVSDV